MKNRCICARLSATALSLLSLCFATTLQAQNIELVPVVVTASLLEQRVVDALPATTLITRQDIQRTQSADLPALLRQQAGIELGQLGGPGGVATAFVRGAESRHLVVLIDGLPTSSLHFSLAAIEHLSLADVDRIEIVRGNVSSIYGSSAMGGVIQIFTGRKATGPWLDTKAEISSRGYKSAQISTGVLMESGLQISGSLEKLDGGNFNSMNQSQKPGTNPDNDGYLRTSSSVRISRQLDEGKVVLSSRESRGKIRYDSQFGPATQADESIHVIRSTQLGSSWRITPALTIDVNAGQSEDRLDAQITASPYFVYSTTKMFATGASWRLKPAHALTAGLEVSRQDIKSDTAYDLSSRDLHSSRAGYQYDDERHQVQVNVRQDSYSGSEDARTWYTAYAFHVTPAWRVRASRSTGFMTPTFNDLYYPATSWAPVPAWNDPGCTNCYGGNPNLKPERSKSQDIGLQYFADGHDLRLTVFENRYTDLIATDSEMPYGRVNLASAANDGVEIIYRGQFNQNTLTAGLTLQDPRDLNSGKVLDRRAKTLFNASYFRSLGAFEVGTQLRFQGARMDGVNRLASYTVLDFLLSRKILPELTIFGRIENALDRDYQTNFAYNTAGRSLFVGLKWSPKI
jgi:vitamin B12 transporter